MKAAPPCRVGLISDTHGFVDPKIKSIFSGVDHILHAGDVGPPAVIYQLEEIAPVTAVLGNNDFDLTLREMEVLVLQQRTLMVYHIVPRNKLTPELQAQIDRYKPDLLLFGHSHRQYLQQIGRTLFVNPGYSGKPRLGLHRSVALLTITPKEMKVEFVEL